MNPILIAVGLFGQIVQLVILTQIPLKYFNILDKIVINLRNILFFSMVIFYFIAVFSNDDLIWSIFTYTIGTGGTTIAWYSFIFWIAKYKRKQLLEEGRKKQ